MIACGGEVNLSFCHYVKTTSGLTLPPSLMVTGDSPPGGKQLMYDINHSTPCDFKGQETIGAVPPQENLGS